MGAESEGRSLYQRLEDLSTNFITSASSVDELSERFEYVLQSYILPAFAYAEASFERKPILTVFTLVFLTLSLVPFLTFATVCCAALSTYLVVGLLSVLIISAGTILTLSTILLSVLFGTGIAATFITTTIVSAYLVLRLTVHVRQDGFAGAAAWFYDIRNYVLGSLPPFSNVFQSSSGDGNPPPPTDVTLTWKAPAEVKEDEASNLDELRSEAPLAGEGAA
ncbi:hypothetical protein FA13DRAFT_1790398 [Coprinellus micaceus]|uniref:Uncharacterized protein n=1 Tax=Coprinellus micaceus TaxID=71717 RepID=A0A4Y7TER7_COPMI|nr:hypothetical protein FA13DRAFT_1790398 [Coprinellus micaceus]